MKTAVLTTYVREHRAFWGRAMRSLSTSVVEDPRSAPFHLCQSGIHPGDALPVEGLRMAQPFEHRPVMLDEIVMLFAPVADRVPGGVVIDATLGGAGHSAALLRAYPTLRLLGIDQDPQAVKAARKVLEEFEERVAIADVRFDEIEEAFVTAFGDAPVAGVLFDLGVSSPQLDWTERGFSYRNSGPLDMRMNPRQELDAAAVINTYDEAALIEVLRSGGEDRFAPRIARSIIAARPIVDTVRLAEIVRSAIPAPARRRPGDPAKRSFQAIRLEVNQELQVLSHAIASALSMVAPGGRVVTLAYHSGEDRLVKQKFVEASTGGCVCPQDLPCGCGAIPTVRLLTRGSRKPSVDELRDNPRAESARLRAVELLATQGGSAGRRDPTQQTGGSADPTQQNRGFADRRDPTRLTGGSADPTQQNRGFADRRDPTRLTGGET